MESKRELAIVLRAIPFQERHRIITALTERHGKVSALAKNAIHSKRFGGALELFTASDWIYTERPGAELFSVNEAQVRKSFDGLRKSLEKLALASVFGELMLRLAPDREPCFELFKLHSNALSALEELPPENENQRNLLILLNCYLAKLLQWSGNEPQLVHCSGCQARLLDQNPEDELACIIENASWLCPDCRTTMGNHKIVPMAAIDFHLCLGTPIKKIIERIQSGTEEQKNLFRFLEALLVYHVSGFDKSPLKGLRFLAIG